MRAAVGVDLVVPLDGDEGDVAVFGEESGADLECDGRACGGGLDAAAPGGHGRNALDLPLSAVEGADEGQRVARELMCRRGCSRGRRRCGER
ncbi:hypothetical protein GS934_01870 [Rhodococcus hoagii]|nr:hypothetical protein [Prescottella equi]NKZ86866.1 hypothetical protein [Prescottella equi]